MQQNARQDDTSTWAYILGETRAQVHERRFQNVGDTDVKIGAVGDPRHCEGLWGVRKGLGQVHFDTVLDVVEVGVERRGSH
jgi:hypothetical protein